MQCVLLHRHACCRFLQATKNLDKLLKNKGEQEKRKRNVQKMQKDAVSDNEEDEEAAEQMAANAQRQAQTLQAEDGDPEPEVLQQVLFPQQVCSSLCRFDWVSRVYILLRIARLPAPPKPGSTGGLGLSSPLAHQYTSHTCLPCTLPTAL